MLRLTISRIAFWLSIACNTGLVTGFVVEVASHQLIFEDYISTFFTWAFIFAIINAVTRRSANEPTHKG
jgi:hypothetical protein